MIYTFYDTCSLLLAVDNLFQDNEFRIVISSITLEELENIKTSVHKDPEIKFAARKVIKILDEHYDNNDYDVIIWNNDLVEKLNSSNLPITNDSKIIICAKYWEDKIQSPMKFYTNDLCCKHLAQTILKNSIILSYQTPDYDYNGYKEVTMNDDEMADFYSNPTLNKYNLLINEYLIIKDQNNEIVDKLCWSGENYRHLNYNNFKSNHFGDVKPYKNDVYQVLVADSFENNKITMVKGPAGSGKTFLSLGFLLHKLERNKIDKIIIFCNTIATKNSAKLGFYPGTRDEKLLDSQIGNLLSSKLGDRTEVEKMIAEGKLVLMPLSDCRGYDTSGMHAGIYISEAQNMDTNLMKLALQRIGEDNICIIDGDYSTQVDLEEFAGANNGMKRASKIFRGSDIYGEITLKNIHRSKIAKLAEKI